MSGRDSTGIDPFGTDPFGGDPFGGLIDSTLKNPPLQSGQNKKAELPFSSAASREASQVSDETGAFQNAIIEGIQLTAEKGDASDEQIITCYFIFRDKPTSYFYDVIVREKQLVFEFNDTRTGSSPVPTASESPIKGFKIESGKVDLNKEIKGLLPEWHDMIKVTFDLEAVPKIHVNDEYSIISFSFKWSSNPDKLKLYTIKDNSRKIIFLSAGGVVGIGAGVLAYIFLKPEPPDNTLKPIDIRDIPKHEHGQQ